MQFPAYYFNRQTDQRVCRGVYGRNPPEMERKTAESKGNRKTYKSNGLDNGFPQTRDQLFWRNCERVKHPATRNEKTYTCPSRSRLFHGRHSCCFCSNDLTNSARVQSCLWLADSIFCVTSRCHQMRPGSSLGSMSDLTCFTSITPRLPALASAMLCIESNASS